MKMLVGTLTQRNQVHVPAEIRRHLGVRPADKLVFIIEDDGEVHIDRAEFDLDSAYASVPALATPMPIEDQVRQAKEEKALRDYGPARAK